MAEKRVSRRRFLALSSACPLAFSRRGSAFGMPLCGAPSAASALPAAQAQTRTTVRDFLEQLTYRREEVATLLDRSKPNITKFDPELGWLFVNYVVKEGMNGSLTILNIESTGERKKVNYADRPCRLNTYGDSFTQCNQVSDGETWQEKLAAHFGEPIRNFGVGGYGVYQAHRRMLREEATPSAAEYIILNIWGDDDHRRSVDAWQWLRLGEQLRGTPYGRYRFAVPWAHVRLNLDTGKIAEKANPYPTPESLYKLTDKDYVVQTFENDLVVQFFIAERGGSGVNLKYLKDVADALEVVPDFSSPEATSRTGHLLHNLYALRVSMQVVEKAQAFAREKKKKLMVLLSYGMDTVMRACEGFSRPDQEFVDFLKDRGIRFLDGLDKHRADFLEFHVSPREYVGRYYIGHYNPLGNHFFAFAIKDAIVDWLDPKPFAYREGTGPFGSVSPL
jgi:hypothetical protein